MPKECLQAAFLIWIILKGDELMRLNKIIWLCGIAMAVSGCLNPLWIDD
jgi:hypothetical protein